jgi:hypothetical protein
MITAYQFGRRLVRWLTIADLSALQLDACQEILDQINTGITDVLLLGPQQWRRMPWPITLAAPASREITVTQGSTAITGDQASDIYCSISVNQDCRNRIIDTNTLEWAYPALSLSGTYLATVYNDAIALPPNFASIFGDPKIIGHDRNFRSRLTKKDCRNEIFMFNHPRHWWIEPLGIAQQLPANKVTPMGFLRLWPKPHREMRLDIEIEVRGAQFTIDQLTATEGETDVTCAIPMPDDVIMAILEPIVIGKLSASEMWKRKEPQAIKRALDDSDRAYQKLAAIPKSFSRGQTFTMRGLR